MELEIENAENEPKIEKQKLRRKKWKLRARNVEGIGGKIKGPTNLKRPMSLMNWESPRGKESKIGNPQTFEISQRAQRNGAAAMKLTFENENGELRGELQNQQRKHRHETYKLERSRAGERSNILRNPAVGAGGEASNLVSFLNKTDVKANASENE